MQDVPTRRQVLSAAAATCGALVLPYPVAASLDDKARRGPFASALQELHAYQRIVGSTRDDDLWWWHFGEIHLYVPRRGIVPVARAQTISFNRMEWVGAGRNRTHFTEAGCLLDLDVDERVSRWFNPFTQTTHQSANGPLAMTTFVEGPGTLDYAVVGDRLVNNSEIARDTVTGLDAQWDIAGGRVTCTTRRENDEMAIVQRFHADESVLRTGDVVSAEASKHYTMIRAASSVTEWAPVEDDAALMIVRGYGRKAAASEMVDQAMYDRLRSLHPAVVPAISDYG